MNKVILITILQLLSLYNYGNQTLLKDNQSVSIWKYVEKSPKYGDIYNISQKIYYISLYFDGTYHQYVEIIPINPKNYIGIKYFELNGKWYIQNDSLILEEYGKKQSIDYSFFNNNFENIDNQIFIKK